MQRWAAHYLGETVLPFALSDLEIQFFFTLSETDRSALRALPATALAGRRAAPRLSPPYGCSLDAFKVVPHRVLAYLGEQLEVEVPTLGVASRTLPSTSHPLRASGVGDGASGVSSPRRSP